MMRAKSTLDLSQSNNISCSFIRMCSCLMLWRQVCWNSHQQFPRVHLLPPCVFSDKTDSRYTGARAI